MDSDALMPTVELIMQNGISYSDKDNMLKEFDAIGRSVARLVSEHCSVKGTHKILDVGVGLGRVARVFTETLEGTGSYVGIDSTKWSIEWCREQYRPFPNFSFCYADVFSVRYNPEASIRPEDYEFPFPDGVFDVVFSSSLYTPSLRWCRKIPV
jgi:ubiquinone/menaquinone biosynthesis C-methylase UbiE